MTLDLPLTARLVLDQRHTQCARRLVDRLAAIAIVPSLPSRGRFLMSRGASTMLPPRRRADAPIYRTAVDRVAWAYTLG
jgi:hypothetical protein